MLVIYACLIQTKISCKQPVHSAAITSIGFCGVCIKSAAIKYIIIAAFSLNQIFIFQRAFCNVRLISDSISFETD